MANVPVVASLRLRPSVLASHSEHLRSCGSCRCRAPAADLLQVRGRNSSKYIKTTRPVLSPSGETLTNQVFQPSRARRRRSVFFFPPLTIKAKGLAHVGSVRQKTAKRTGRVSSRRQQFLGAGAQKSSSPPPRQRDARNRTL